MKTILLMIGGTWEVSSFDYIRQWACTLLIMIVSFAVYSQQLSIGTGVPDGTAVVDIVSTNKGILVPRMTTAQRLMIAFPATGLLLFDITTSSFWYHDTQGWMELESRWIRSGNNIYNANSGNVGIGTTSPAFPLDVHGTIKSQRPGSSPDGSSISFTSPSGDPGIIIARGDGTGGVERRWDLKIDDDNSFRIVDNTANKLCLMVDHLGRVSIGEMTPSNSALLDVNSTTKGFLPPRMSKAQRDLISSPTEGLIVICIDCGANVEAQVFNGVFWTNIIGGPPAGLAVGDVFEGGIVAYIYQSGDPGYVTGEIHGLIAASADLDTSTWGCYLANLPGSDGIALGTGLLNTQQIVENCGETNIAARLCYDLNLNGYLDWFLPSKNELNKLFLNRLLIGGFDPNIYWSSSEFDNLKAWTQSFLNGTTSTIQKNINNSVRAIRYF